MPALAPLEMSVPAADGLILKGTLRYPDRAPPRRSPLAVLAHQYPSTRDSFAPLAHDLLGRGIAVLAFDLRGHGASFHGPSGPLVIDTPAAPTPEAFGRAFVASAGKVGFARIADDIVRVASWGLAQNFVDSTRLLLVGASVGGTGAILAAADLAAVRGTITLGAAGALAHGPDGPERIRRVVEGGKAPFLLASSEGDAFDGAANARQWSSGLAHAKLELVPGDGHGMAIYFDVRDAVLSFVDRVVG